MGLWKILGDYLAGSGWTAALTEAGVYSSAALTEAGVYSSAALTEAGVYSSGTVESLLTASHLTKTRHAHQVFLAALGTLQHQAFSHAQEF